MKNRFGLFVLRALKAIGEPATEEQIHNYLKNFQGISNETTPERLRAALDTGVRLAYLQLKNSRYCMKPDLPLLEFLFPEATFEEASATQVNQSVQAGYPFPIEVDALFAQNANPPDFPPALLQKVQAALDEVIDAKLEERRRELSRLQRRAAAEAEAAASPGRATKKPRIRPQRTRKSPRSPRAVIVAVASIAAVASLASAASVVPICDEAAGGDGPQQQGLGAGQDAQEKQKGFDRVMRSRRTRATAANER